MKFELEYRVARTLYLSSIYAANISLLSRSLARLALACSALLHWPDSAIKILLRGLPVPMGAILEYASGGGATTGIFLKRRRRMGEDEVGRSSRGGEKKSVLVRRRSGRRQLSRYTGSLLTWGVVSGKKTY